MRSLKNHRNPQCSCILAINRFLRSWADGLVYPFALGEVDGNSGRGMIWKRLYC